MEYYLKIDSPLVKSVEDTTKYPIFVKLWNATEFDYIYKAKQELKNYLGQRVIIFKESIIFTPATHTMEEVDSCPSE